MSFYFERLACFQNAFEVFRAYFFKYYIRISVMYTVDVVTLAVNKLKL